MIRCLTELKRAVQRRNSLDKAGLEAYRLFHGFTESVGCGVSIDRYKSAIYIRHASRRFDYSPWLQAAQTFWPDKPMVFLDLTQKVQTPQRIQGDTPQNFVVSEHSRRFQINLENARNTGLFLDARPARDWVQEHSDEQHILDLFSYTGAFSVAALHGGASEVELVDNNKTALARARDNVELNGFKVGPRQFHCEDIYQALKKYSKSERQFSGIIFDPPPAFKSKRRQFKSQRNYYQLFARVLPLLAPGGWLLALCTDRKVTQAAFKARLIDTAQQCQVRLVAERLIHKGMDFPWGRGEVGIRGAILRRE